LDNGPKALQHNGSRAVRHGTRRRHADALKGGREKRSWRDNAGVTVSRLIAADHSNLVVTQRFLKEGDVPDAEVLSGLLVVTGKYNKIALFGLVRFLVNPLICEGLGVRAVRSLLIVSLDAPIHKRCAPIDHIIIGSEACC
jgi:hypothetical protein